MDVVARHEILLPVKPTFIVVTFVAAAMLNMMPWTGLAAWLRPDFVALVLLYWIIDQPRLVGFTAAFTLGLLMDVAEGALLGQHALSYTILAYAAIAPTGHAHVTRFADSARLRCCSERPRRARVSCSPARNSPLPLFMGSIVAGALWPGVSLLRVTQVHAERRYV